MNILVEEGRVIESGTLEDTDGAKGLLIAQQKSEVIGLYVSNEEILKEMPNMIGKYIRITVEIIRD